MESRPYPLSLALKHLRDGVEAEGRLTSSNFRSYSPTTTYIDPMSIYCMLEGLEIGGGKVLEMVESSCYYVSICSVL